LLSPSPCPGSIFIRDGEALPPVPAQPGKRVDCCVEACLHCRSSSASSGRRTSLGCSGQCCRRLRGLAGGLRRARGASLRARPLALTQATGTGAEVVRRRAPLLAENAVLRQQLLVLRRRVTRPGVTAADRALLVVLAGRVRAWRQALLLVRPATLLRWHRAGFRSCWRGQSRPGPGRPPLPAETIALIRRLATAHPRWGAERSRGERGKLGSRVAQRTSQTDRRGHRAPRPRGQTWATFLRNHAPDSWACDFLPVTDLPFRPLCACFVVELATRHVVHLGVTRQPTDVWVAQQRREATPAASARATRSATTTARSGRASRGWRRRAASRSCTRRTARRGRTPCASASWAACGASASTSCSCWASATSPVRSASTAPTSTGHDHTRASGKRCPRRYRRGPGAARGRYARCPSWAACTTRMSLPRRADGCISSQDSRRPSRCRLAPVDNIASCDL